MKYKWLALMFLAGSSLFAAPRVYFGVGIGYAPAPVPMYVAPPAPVVAYAPPAPGPGYTWIRGYWYPSGPRWAWRAGYWSRPPYARAYWVGPRYLHGRYYGGYWRR
jgi:hypothetical protein